MANYVCMYVEYTFRQHTQEIIFFIFFLQYKVASIDRFVLISSENEAGRAGLFAFLQKLFLLIHTFLFRLTFD